MEKTDTVHKKKCKNKFTDVELRKILSSSLNGTEKLMYLNLYIDGGVTYTTKNGRYHVFNHSVKEIQELCGFKNLKTTYNNFESLKENKLVRVLKEEDSRIETQQFLLIESDAIFKCKNGKDIKTEAEKQFDMDRKELLDRLFNIKEVEEYLAENRIIAFESKENFDKHKVASKLSKYYKTNEHKTVFYIEKDLKKKFLGQKKTINENKILNDDVVIISKFPEDSQCASILAQLLMKRIKKNQRTIFVYVEHEWTGFARLLTNETEKKELLTCKGTYFRKQNIDFIKYL